MLLLKKNYNRVDTELHSLQGNKRKAPEEGQQKYTTNKKMKLNKPPLHNGIISSRLHQSSPIFVGPGQGLQCVANCIISLIYHKHFNCANWKLIDIKNILYSGNILYNSIGKFTTILVSDLPKYIKLYKTIYNIQEVNSLIGNIYLDNPIVKGISFDKLKSVIVKYKYMILILGSSALSIIYSNNIFYTFDPHKRNTYGLPDSSGGAAILKFNSFSQLCSYIDELSQHLCTTDYELTPIVITKYTETNANGKSCQNFSPETDQDKYKNINNSSDTKSKTDRNICTKNSSWQNEHSTTAIETNDDIFLQKPLDNTNITQAEILKTVTSDKYDPERTEIIETDEIKLQEQTENIEKSKENTSKNITQVARETTSNSEPIANSLKEKNENTSESKLILDTNDISGKIQNNIKTTMECVYI